MKNTSFLLFIFLLAITFSCNKDYNAGNNTGPVFKTYSSMDTIYQMLGVPSKFVMIDAVTGGSFYGNSGTRYIFPPNCFQDGTGASVTGFVQIEVVEYLKKGDMIFSKMLPISDDQPLMSAGEISVRATQSGQPVYLKPGMQFRANIPQGGPADPAMAIFFGRPYSKSGTFSNVSNVNWIPNNGIDSFSSSIVVINGDTVSILGDSLTMFNGDHYLTGVPTTRENSLSLTSAKGTINANQLLMFVVVDNKKSLWPIYGNANPVTSFLTIDQPCHIIAYGLVDKRFYAGDVSILANTNPGVKNNYTLLVSEVDPLAFKNQLNSLY